MLSIRHLFKRYGARTALNDLSLTVGKGVILGLLGPNGAGKTTLVSILNGLIDFEQGEVEAFGLPLRENLACIRSRSALVPQSLSLYDKLTVVENLRFFAAIQNRTKAEARKRIEAAVAAARLDGLLRQKAATLSGGQKRRLNIAIGLLNDPELLYFDEPTTGLDPEARNDILETIRSFKKEDKTVIYTSHYLPEIEKICDEVAIVHRGRLVRHGTLDTLLGEGVANQAVIEIQPTPSATLQSLAGRLPALRVIDSATLILADGGSTAMGALLGLLEQKGIGVHQVRFTSGTLESLFLRLTVPEAES